mmetsp:Transcript_7324/g.29430  ORF Transcript_7324/g.29430 Transcript_7324/m.29430 type:complete len:201 (+) Transcript_7324:841-1443(+)
MRQVDAVASDFRTRHQVARIFAHHSRRARGVTGRAVRVADRRGDRHRASVLAQSREANVGRRTRSNRWHRLERGVRAPGRNRRRHGDGARGTNSGRSRFRSRGANEGDERIFRWLAHAHRARGGAVHDAGFVVAGRTDESLGRARFDVARRVFTKVGKDGPHRVARSRLFERLHDGNNFLAPQKVALLRRILRYLPQGAR